MNTMEQCSYEEDGARCFLTAGHHPPDFHPTQEHVASILRSLGVGLAVAEIDFDEGEHPDAELTVLQMMAANSHESYLEFHEAGFPPAHALYLVSCILTGKPALPPD